MLRQVTLHGPLAARFSADSIRLNADDVHSLMSGLNSAYPGFKATLRDAGRVAIALKSDEGLTFISEETVGWSFGSATELHVATEEHGSAAHAAAWVASYFAAGSAAATAAYAVAYIAVTYAIGAAMGAIARSLADKPQTQQAATEQTSYLFDQAANLEGQGHPVPLVYGLFRCGTVVISSDVLSEKSALAVNDSYTATAGQTLTANIFANDIDGGTMVLTNFIINETVYAPGATATVGAGTTVSISSTGALVALSSLGVGVTIRYTAASPTTAGATAVVQIRFLSPPSEGSTWDGI